MDTLTHALSGALLARATEPASYDKDRHADQLPRRLRMWVGAWSAAFPDSDFVVSFVNSYSYLTVHRGVTHSILMLPLWAMGLAFLFRLITRQRYAWRAFVGTCALGIAAHIAGDIITSFGTMVLAPLSHWRAELSTTFIIDLYFSGIIVAGLIASWYWSKTRVPALAALALLAGYVGFQALQHHRAVEIGNAYIATRHLESAEAEAMPQPFSPFNWLVIVQQPNAYHLSYISLWRQEAPPPPPDDAHWLSRANASYRPANQALWESVPRYGRDPSDAALAETVWRADTLARYRDFALFPALYRVDREPQHTCVWFSDLRFAMKGRTMPFRYGACRDQGAHDNAWKIYRLQNDDTGRDLLDAIPD